MGVRAGDGGQTTKHIMSDQHSVALPPIPNPSPTRGGRELSLSSENNQTRQMGGQTTKHIMSDRHSVALPPSPTPYPHNGGKGLLVPLIQFRCSATTAITCSTRSNTSSFGNRNTLNPWLINHASRRPSYSACSR